jgi:pantothenate synthetase
VHDVDRDVEFAWSHGATHVISGRDEELYPDTYRTFLRQEPAMHRLDAKTIDYLFPGMITMSVRWIIFVRPHRTYWGEKDIAQSILVRRAVSDLLIDTEVRRVPCVRFRSGIPISSRLLRLDRSSLIEVRQVYRALEAGRAEAANGDRTAGGVLGRVRATLDDLPLAHFSLCHATLASPVDFTDLEVARPPFILHVAMTDGVIFHFDGLLIETKHELHDGARVLWLDEEWPCAA